MLNTLEVWWIGFDGSVQDAYWYEGGGPWNQVTLAPKPDKPEPNRRFRRRSALGHTGYFGMICRFTSARIFPQRGCKLSEPNGFKPLRPIHHRIICALSPINFAHKRQ